MTDDTISTAGEMIAYPQPTFAGAVEGATVEAIAKLARDGSEPKVLLIPTDGLGRGLPKVVPVLWDRDNQAFISVLKEVRAAAPDLERTGTATVSTLDSFIALVNRHADEAGSVIFASTQWPNPSLTGIIDYHTTHHAADFGRHRVRYAFPVTKEFTEWVNHNEKPFSQMEFASFIESRILDLSVPDTMDADKYQTAFRDRFALPNELADLARNLEVHVKSKVKDGGRLKSGARQVAFEEEHSTASGDPIDIPGLFWISLAPFLSGEGPSAKVGIPVRLFYRVKDGSILWFYSLYGWEEILRERVQRDLATAATATGLPAFEGTPEMTAA